MKFLKMIFLVLFPTMVFSNVVTSTVSVTCEADEDSRVSMFNFDLYATGHPMGGVSMYSGIFETNLPCRRGYIGVTSSTDKHLHFNASLNCISETEMKLEIETEVLNPKVSYPATLLYRDKLPLGTAPWNTQKMTCTQQ